MEKYGTRDQDLLESLRNEEAQLMSEMASAISNPTKTAADQTDIDRRLQRVRMKIYELDGIKTDE
jgi:hypothetical protein